MALRIFVTKTLAGALGLAAVPASAVTFNVGTVDELAAAMQTANFNRHGDVINLTADIVVSSIYEYDAAYGDVGLPPTNSVITIKGNGSAIRRTGLVPFRLTQTSVPTDDRVGDADPIVAVGGCRVAGRGAPGSVPPRLTLFVAPGHH